MVSNSYKKDRNKIECKLSKDFQNTALIYNSVVTPQLQNYDGVF